MRVRQPELKHCKDVEIFCIGYTFRPTNLGKTEFETLRLTNLTKFPRNSPWFLKAVIGSQTRICF